MTVMSISRDEWNRWLHLLPTTALATLAVVTAIVLADSGQNPAAASTAKARIVSPARPAPPAKTYDSPLGLRVTSKPQQLQVYWDRDSQPVRHAVKGVMQISDGDVSEMIPFDTRQLQDGYLAYRPVTNDVSIRLELDQDGGQKVSESVRVVATP
jgi:hypothetical protein